MKWVTPAIHVAARTVVARLATPLVVAAAAAVGVSLPQKSELWLSSSASSDGQCVAVASMAALGRPTLIKFVPEDVLTSLPEAGQ